MKILRTVLTSCIVFVLLTDAAAQRLLIHYDYLKDNLSFLETNADGTVKETSQAVVKRNHQVKIEVTNLNPFIYTAIADFSNTKFNERPNLGFLSLVSPLSMTSVGTSFLSQINGSDMISRSTQGVMAIPEARIAYRSIENTYNALYKAEELMKNIDFVTAKVYQLKTNPYLPGDSIRLYSQELIDQLFIKSHVETKDFLNMANRLHTTVQGDLSIFKANVQSFLNIYYGYSSTVPDPNFEGKGLDAQVKNWQADADSFVLHFNYEQMQKKLEVLEQLYLSIMNTPFTYNASEVASGDELTITVTFYKLGEEALFGVEDLEVLFTKEIKIVVKGDIKVSSSAGVAFPYYRNNLEFINKDSLVSSIEGNNFTPNLSAYLSFYPYSGRGIQFGGTFGVGIPMSTDSKNFNFLFGFSTILGYDNRIVISMGPTLGQVNRLDRGYTLGDNLGDLISPAPTRTSYEFGGFIGISFSLSQITQ